MEESQTNRETIGPEEFSILESLSQQLQEMILNLFTCEEINVESSPFRYKWKHEKHEYEFIFSSMGSFTIRPITNGRRSFPIFYLSVGKYSGNFFWENTNQEIIKLHKNSLKDKILSAIINYEKNF